MIVFALFIETSYEPSKALAAVRAARPGTVELRIKNLLYLTIDPDYSNDPLLMEMSINISDYRHI